MLVYKVPSVIGFCSSDETQFRTSRVERRGLEPMTYVNRGPVRFRPCLKSDISEQEVQDQKQRHWDSHRNILDLEGLPVSVDEAQKNKEALIKRIEEKPCKSHEELRALKFLRNLEEGNSANNYQVDILKQNDHRRARELFKLSMVAVSLLPIANFVSGIRKIVAGIKDDGSSFGVVEEDRGLKFKATVIAVGIAEICFLGLIVHGFATFYFAITPPPPMKAWEPYELC